MEILGLNSLYDSWSDQRSWESRAVVNGRCILAPELKTKFRQSVNPADQYGEIVANPNLVPPQALARTSPLRRMPTVQSDRLPVKLHEVRHAT
jgi:hypothetical protein